MQQTFLAELALSSERLLASIIHLSETQAHFKATDSTWSVLECLEHIFIVEAGIYKNLKSEGLTEQGAESVTNRSKVSGYMQDRNLKIDAPDFTTPKGRFTTLAEGMQAFVNKRAEIATIIQSSNLHDGFISKHPRLGDMTKSDWVHFMLEHTNRHIEQLGEIQAVANFPKI
jgi:hypothetical protein